MRRIKVNKWSSRLPTGEEASEDILVALNVLIGAKKPEEIPRGIDKFRIFGKIAEAFDKAIESNVLELEEREYNFLKTTIEKDVPSTWAMNKNLSAAIISFLEAKEE
jgi:hypothetical protein